MENEPKWDFFSTPMQCGISDFGARRLLLPFQIETIQLQVIIPFFCRPLSQFSFTRSGSFFKGGIGLDPRIRQNRVCLSLFRIERL